MEEKKNNEVGSGALREALLNPEFQYRVAEKWWNDSAGPDRPFHRQRESSIYQIYLDRVREVIGIALSLSSPIEPPQITSEQSERLERVRKQTRAASEAKLGSVLIALDLLELLLERPTPQASSEIREALADAFLAHRDNTMNAIDDYEGSGTKDSLYALIDAVFMPLLAPSRQGAGDNPDHYGLDRPRQGATK